jgi:hypothetical protein
MEYSNNATTSKEETFETSETQPRLSFREAGAIARDMFVLRRAEPAPPRLPGLRLLQRPPRCYGRDNRTGVTGPGSVTAGALLRSYE